MLRELAGREFQPPTPPEEPPREVSIEETEEILRGRINAVARVLEDWWIDDGRRRSFLLGRISHENPDLVYLDESLPDKKLTVDRKSFITLLSNLMQELGPSEPSTHISTRYGYESRTYRTNRDGLKFSSCTHFEQESEKLTDVSWSISAEVPGTAITREELDALPPRYFLHRSALGAAKTITLEADAEFLNYTALAQVSAVFAKGIMERLSGKTPQEIESAVAEFREGIEHFRTTRERCTPVELSVTEDHPGIRLEFDDQLEVAWPYKYETGGRRLGLVEHISSGFFRPERIPELIKKIPWNYGPRLRLVNIPQLRLYIADKPTEIESRVINRALHELTSEIYGLWVEEVRKRLKDATPIESGIIQFPFHSVFEHPGYRVVKFEIEDRREEKAAK